MKPIKPMEPMKPVQRWWPAALGDSPDSAGGQNELRYAYFGDQHRLAVDDGRGVTVYDTGEHEVSGVHQRQGGGGKAAAFTSRQGEVDLDTLPTVAV